MSDGGVVAFMEADLRDCIAMAEAHSVILQVNDGDAFVARAHVKGVGPDADAPPFSVAGADATLAGALMYLRTHMKKIRREPV